jgi:hypothetical protein
LERAFFSAFPEKHPRGVFFNINLKISTKLMALTQFGGKYANRTGADHFGIDPKQIRRSAPYMGDAFEKPENFL